MGDGGVAASVDYYDGTALSDGVKYVADGSMANYGSYTPRGLGWGTYYNEAVGSGY